MSERRYSDEEVAEIFARASEKEQTTRRQLPASEGMTLAQLQDIGREAGLAPELVAQAARSLDHTAQPSTPRLFGLPLGAARTVYLERRMTDQEWERLVVDLRETFNARGTVRVEGSFRSWSNGNLQALVEPDGDGQRVRFRTIKGNARPYVFGGLAAVGASAVMFASQVLSDGLGQAGAGELGLIALGGAALAAWGALPLKSWAALRARQMEELADRLTASLPVRSG